MQPILVLILLLWQPIYMYFVMCAQTSPFIQVISKGCLALPKRFSRHRVMPPEFRKKYFPIVTEKELESYRDTDCVDPNRKMAEFSPTREAPRHLRLLYQELLPHNLDPRYRDRLRERLERREMMLRRRHLHIPEFYVGSVLATTVADKHAPNKKNRFVGICIERNNEGLWSNFTLRNVIDQTAVEVNFELYNPTLLSIEVLLLEKRLDRNLLYLRDAPLSESRFPFDLAPVPHEKDAPVPINDKKVKLLPRPWHFQWHLHGYRGIDLKSMYSHLTTEELNQIEKKVDLIDRYDLMKMYRSRITPAEENTVMGEVGRHHTELLRHMDFLKGHWRNGSASNSSSDPP
ncbi:39S ribosomal protein L19, mitochondrial [Echinococcus granulosus]|uniref:Large ribosomal subunit protein bL19m n=1 Tax=Echinococcus granulosus TaxID=6210 RepID=A0A068WMY4_ECHGR|nr:39S ribosomal protein L19, mitochondrial [Echinococcus granulosus]CDS19039.1 39S ribosomal protein L19 mitochondrial [Echinococcus granulosus]